MNIVNISNHGEDSLTFLDSTQLYLQKMLPNLEKSFRIVGRAMSDMGIEIAMAIQARWGKNFMPVFLANLTVLCCAHVIYQTRGNNPWMKWFRDLQENYHAYMTHKN